MISTYNQPMRATANAVALIGSTHLFFFIVVLFYNSYEKATQ